MMKSMCLVVLLVFALVSIPSESRSITLKPQHSPNFKISSPHHQSAKTCSYYLQVTTSCNSSVTTRDEISIVFGDHCGNQAGVLRINNSSGKTFDACANDAFLINDAPCLLNICYYKIYRSGSDGWKPEYFGLRGPFIYYIRFDVNEWIPDDEWYGANSCSKYDPDQCSDHKLVQRRNKVQSIVLNTLAL